MIKGIKLRRDKEIENRLVTEIRKNKMQQSSVTNEKTLVKDTEEVNLSQKLADSIVQSVSQRDELLDSSRADPEKNVKGIQHLSTIETQRENSRFVDDSIIGYMSPRNHIAINPTLGIQTTSKSNMPNSPSLPQRIEHLISIRHASGQINLINQQSKDEAKATQTENSIHNNHAKTTNHALRITDVKTQLDRIYKVHTSQPDVIYSNEITKGEINFRNITPLGKQGEESFMLYDPAAHFMTFNSFYVPLKTKQKNIYSCSNDGRYGAQLQQHNVFGTANCPTDKKPLWCVSTKSKPNDQVVNYKTERGLRMKKLSTGENFQLVRIENIRPKT